MAGSEKTGYENSTDHLLENAYYIVTPPSGQSSGSSQEIRENGDRNTRRIVAVAETIGAIPLVLDYRSMIRWWPLSATCLIWWPPAL